MIEKAYRHLIMLFNEDGRDYGRGGDDRVWIQSRYYDLYNIIGLLPKPKKISGIMLSDMTYAYHYTLDLLFNLNDIDKHALTFNDFTSLANYIKLQSLEAPAKKEEVKVSRHDMIDHVINLFYMADDFTDSTMSMEKVYRPYYDMFDDVEPYVRGAKTGGMSVHKAFKFFIVEIVFNYFYSMRDKHINLLMRCDDNLIFMSTLALVVDTIEEDGNGI